MVTCGVFSRWKIEGISTHVVGEDGEIYRLPYTNGLKHYGLRKIKKQYPNRYKINGVWWSQNQLRGKLVLDTDPVELIKSDELPF